MSDPFDLAIQQSFSRAESGEAMDLVVGADGMTTYELPEPEMAPQPVPASMTRRERRGQEPTITPMEGLQQFGEAMGGAVAGLLPGAVAGSVGTPGDIAGLFAGAYEAATAEEGERLNAFLQTMTDISGQYGSEAALNFGRSIVEELPVSEQVKEGMRGGLEAGSFVGIGGAATAGAKSTMSGLRKIKEIADQADSQYMFPFDQLDQVTTIAPDEVAEFEELARQYRFTQPIESADDAVDLAKTNQQILGRSGSSIAKKLGIKFKNPGIKGEADRGKRMAEKAQKKGGIRALSDITRGGFAVQTVQQADQVVEELAKKYRVIDEGFTVTDLGYFDRKLMIINKNGQLGEVQIWAEPLFSAKIEKGGQDLYTVFRGKKPDEMDAEELAAYQETIKKYDIQGDTHEEIVASAKEKSVQLYADALDQADPSMRAIAVDALKGMVSAGGKESETARIMLDRLGEPASDADNFIESINPGGKSIDPGARPNLMMGDMYGMLPDSAKNIGDKDGIQYFQDGNDFYAMAYNPDVGEMDVVGYVSDRGDFTDLAVVGEMQNKGIGTELSYLYRKNNPGAQSGGMTPAGEATARKAYERMVNEGLAQ